MIALQFDDSFIIALKANNAVARTRFYETYSSLLYGEIKSVFPQVEIANDILISSFTQIWKNLNDYDSKKEKLFTWALKITRKQIRFRKINAVINQLFSCQQPSAN